MKRETRLLSALAFLLVTVPAMFTQDPRSQPSPVLPANILGTQLIVWSEAQKPQPVPQPLPAAERPGPDQQPEQPNPAHNPPAQPQPTAQKFTGIIVQNSGVFLLKVSSNNAYQLDDQEKARQYEGKQVIIGGILDANLTSLHVIDLELVS
jgi:lipoprotein-anchoring transpeptidase ErfK/SrfK